MQSILSYIGQFNPAAAQRMALKLIITAASLAEHPDRGRAIGGTRRENTSVHPYVMRYRVLQNRVIILRVRHGARKPLR